MCQYTIFQDVRWLFVSRLFEEASGKICHRNPVGENTKINLSVLYLVLLETHTGVKPEEMILKVENHRLTERLRENFTLPYNPRYLTCKISPQTFTPPVLLICRDWNESGLDTLFLPDFRCKRLTFLTFLRRKTQKEQMV